MSADRKKKTLTAADVLGAEPKWPKEPKEWEKLVGENEVVYEDRHVVVFHDPEDEEHESQRVPGEIRLTLLSKKEGVETLMDLGVADETLSAAILHGIQQAALDSGSKRKASRCAPTSIRRCSAGRQLAFKIRAGKPPKKSDAALSS